MYIGLHIKYNLFLSDFGEASIFSTNCRKKPTDLSEIRGARITRGETKTAYKFWKENVIAKCDTLIKTEG